jgi:hypothetical protein
VHHEEAGEVAAAADWDASFAGEMHQFLGKRCEPVRS